MNKHEVKIEEIYAEAQKQAEIFSLLKTIIIGAVILGAIWLIMSGLQGLKGASKSELEGMAKLVTSFKLSDILHYLIEAALVATTLGYRYSTKRMTREKAKLQRRAEAGDPGRSSSGITDEGNTPE